jgi:hypothetical protein
VPRRPGTLAAFPRALFDCIVFQCRSNVGNVKAYGRKESSSLVFDEIQSNIDLLSCQKITGIHNETRRNIITGDLGEDVLFMAAALPFSRTAFFNCQILTTDKKKLPSTFWSEFFHV